MSEICCCESSTHRTFNTVRKFVREGRISKHFAVRLVDLELRGKVLSDAERSFLVEVRKVFEGM